MLALAQLLGDVVKIVKPINTLNDQGAWIWARGNLGFVCLGFFHGFLLAPVFANTNLVSSGAVENEKGDQGRGSLAQPGSPNAPSSVPTRHEGSVPIGAPSAAFSTPVLPTESVAPQPFWKRKVDLLHRIYDERAIIVSAATETVLVAPASPSLPRSEQILFTIRGAGLVNAPKSFAFKTAQEYRKLKDVSSHFKTVEYHEETRKLFLVTEALGWQARMVLLMQPVTSDRRDEIRWDVIWGSFRGMKGMMTFAAAENGRKAETSIEAVYQAETLPLPKILMGFALETIIQKVAEKMRSFIEREYQQGGVRNEPGTLKGQAK